MSEQLSRAVATEVRRLLDERGWSGRELARRSGLPQPTLTRKLAGDRSFDLDELPPICEALGVDVSELIAWARR